MMSTWTRRAAILALVLAVALPVALTALGAVGGTRERQRAVTLEDEARLATQAAQDLQQRVFGVRDSLVVAATGAGLRAASAAKDRVALARALAEFEPLLGDDVRYVFYEDLEGTLLASSPPAPELIGLNFAHRDYFTGVLRTGRPYISEVYVTAFAGNPPAAAIAVLVHDAAGRADGMIVATLDLTNAARWLAPILATVEDAYLIDQRGRLLARGSRPGEGILSDLAADPYVAAAMGGRAAPGEFRDPLIGQPRLLASADVPEIGWHLVLVESPAKLEAQLAPVVAGFTAVVSVFFVILIAAALALTWFAGRLLRQRDSLATTNVRLEQLSRAKSDFLANMSHELRTPLNAILGFSLLLRERSDVAPEKRQRYLANISDAGEHLLALINDVLDLAKVEAGRVELRPERLTLAALLEPVLASSRAAAERAGVSFEATVPASVTLCLDAQRVRQILLNLLSNAVKFTPAGGSVRMLVSAEHDTLVVAVADSGIGIAAERHDQVFGMFERVNEDRSDASGTGLGLAITKRLVELHGGSISFESTSGAGTTFHLRLPGVIGEAIEGERVLVVEDDLHAAELVAALAAEHGLRCEVVTTVAGALAVIGRGSPLLAVVLDLRLPDGRGEQVLDAIRSGQGTRRLPVSVMTSEDDSPRARELGVSMLLNKPIAVPVLSAWLAELRAAPATAP